MLVTDALNITMYVFREAIDARVSLQNSSSAGAIKILVYVASSRSEGSLKIAESAVSSQGCPRNKQRETERNNGHLYTYRKKEKKKVIRTQTAQKQCPKVYNFLLKMLIT